MREGRSGRRCFVVAGGWRGEGHVSCLQFLFFCRDHIFEQSLDVSLWKNRTCMLEMLSGLHRSLNRWTRYIDPVDGSTMFDRFVMSSVLVRSVWFCCPTGYTFIDSGDIMFQFTLDVM